MCRSAENFLWRLFVNHMYWQLCCWRCPTFSCVFLMASMQVFQHSATFNSLQVLQHCTVYCTFAPNFYFPCLLSCLAWQARMKVISPCFVYQYVSLWSWANHRSVSNPIVHETWGNNHTKMWDKQNSYFQLFQINSFLAAKSKNKNFLCKSNIKLVDFENIKMWIWENICCRTLW
jgi:hypothetical protein